MFDSLELLVVLVGAAVAGGVLYLLRAANNGPITKLPETRRYKRPTKKERPR